MDTKYEDVDFYIYLADASRKDHQELQPLKEIDHQPEDQGDLFETEETQGEGAINFKPWQNELCDSSIPPSKNPFPAKSLKISFVNGVNVLQSNQNTFYSKNGQVIFPAACLGIIMNPKDMSQKYFGGGQKQKSKLFHRFDITALDYCPQIDTIATGSAGRNPEICLWNTQSLKLIKKFSQGQQSRAVGFIRISYNKKNLFTCDRSFDIVLRAFTFEGEQLSSILIRSTVLSMAVGKHYAVGLGSPDGVFLCNLQGKKFKKTDFKNEATTSICFNELGQAIFGTTYGTIYKMSKYKAIHSGAIFAINTKNDLIYSSGSKDLKICVTNMQFNVLKTIPIEEYAKSIDIFNQKIVIATKNGKVIQIDGNSQKQLINGHYAGQLWGVAYNPIHQQFITAGDDNKVIVYDYQKRKVVNQIKINLKMEGSISQLSPMTQFSSNQQARAIDYNPPNEDLAFFLLNGQLQVYQTTHSYEPKYIKKISNTWSQIMRYSPNGKFLAIGCYDTLIYILDGDNYQSLGKLVGHKKPIKNLDWTQDSNFIRSSCGIEQLFYWDVNQFVKVPKKSVLNAKWASFNKFSKQTNKIWYDIISPQFVNEISKSNNGQMLALGDNEGCVRLYSFPAVLRKFKTYKAHSKKVLNLCWSKQDNYIATVGGYDKALIIWKVI